MYGIRVLKRIIKAIENFKQVNKDKCPTTEEIKIAANEIASDGRRFLMNFGVIDVGHICCKNPDLFVKIGVVRVESASRFDNTSYNVNIWDTTEYARNDFWKVRNTEQHRRDKNARKNNRRSSETPHTPE